MRNVGRVFFTTLAGLTLVVAVWALAPPATHEAALLSLANNQGAAAQEQSVSGKIASVEKNSFTLTVGQSQTSTASQNVMQDSASPKTMVFQIDKNTAVEGTLKVGANADVTYRQEKGANIAISVRVTP
jgi:hypothetical protein